MIAPRATVTATVTHLCPYVTERDLGTVTASWAGLVELHALASEFRAFENQQISHEELTARWKVRIEEMGGDDVQVTTTWRTGGLDVVVTA